LLPGACSTARFLRAAILAKIHEVRDGVGGVWPVRECDRDPISKTFTCIGVFAICFTADFISGDA